MVKKARKMKLDKTNIKKAVEKKKETERICRKCMLYDPVKSKCKVVVLFEGQRINIPVNQNDSCFFENEFVSREKVYQGEDLIDIKKERFVPADEIKQVRFWVEDPKTGKQTKGKGIVKMEYPEGFFGKNEEIIGEETP